MKLLKVPYIRIKNARGDTIIEVLLAMAILAVILGTAYASSSHSLQNGVDAGNRNNALGFAREQIEYLKDAYNQVPSTISKYQPPAVTTDFCIPDVGALPVITSDALCKNYKGSQYGMAINYNTSTKVFKVTSSWTANNGSGQSLLVLYYKLPNSFAAGSTSACGTLTLGRVGDVYQIIKNGVTLQVTPGAAQLIDSNSQITCQCTSAISHYIDNRTGTVYNGGPCPVATTKYECDKGNGGSAIVQTAGGATQVVGLNFVCQSVISLSNYQVEA